MSSAPHVHMSASSFLFPLSRIIQLLHYRDIALRCEAPVTKGKRDRRDPMMTLYGEETGSETSDPPRGSCCVFQRGPLMEHRVSLRLLSRLMLGDTESWETAHRDKSHREPRGGLGYTIQPEKQDGRNPSTCTRLPLQHNHISMDSVYSAHKETRIMFVRNTGPQMWGAAPGGVTRVTFLNHNYSYKTKLKKVH